MPNNIFLISFISLYFKISIDFGLQFAHIDWFNILFKSILYNMVNSLSNIDIILSLAPLIINLLSQYKESI